MYLERDFLMRDWKEARVEDTRFIRGAVSVAKVEDTLCGDGRGAIEERRSCSACVIHFR
jgi:hypothetical protein